MHNQAISTRPKATLAPYTGSGTACPLCSGTQWHVGRQTAECAGCGTALLLANAAFRPRQQARFAAPRPAWYSLA